MIPIRNIYYMLSYAFQVLNEQGYRKIATEQFHNVADLCAAILIKGISSQLKRGLGQEYVSKTETLSALRGKIDVSESIKTMTMLRNQMVCTYDEFSVNSRMNQIIKATVKLLMYANISKERKKELKKQLLFFSEVAEIDLNTIDWNIQYNRNNQTYRMLISICYLVVKDCCRQRVMELSALWISWMSRGCVVYMRNSYWNTIERNILKLGQILRRSPGNWTLI